MPNLTTCKQIMLASLLFITTGWSVTALAQPSAFTTRTQLLLAANNNISLDQAVKQVKRDTGGRILTAETVNKDGQAVHRIKVLLPDGNVKIVYINAH